MAASGRGLARAPRAASRIMVPVSPLKRDGKYILCRRGEWMDGWMDLFLELLVEGAAEYGKETLVAGVGSILYLHFS